MLRIIKNHLLVIASIMALTAPILATAGVSADTSVCNNKVAQGISQGLSATATDTNATGGNCGGSSLSTGISSVARTVINIFSIIVGIVSVIMIIYAGFRYITSGGDSGNTSGARNTLLFAIVGLIIVAIAQLIVRYVLHTANNIK